MNNDEGNPAIAFRRTMAAEAEMEQAIAETHDMANIMEMDEDQAMQTKHVEGYIHGFNGCALFLNFMDEGSDEVQVCLFRAHR